jgi:hypothetical protein
MTEKFDISKVPAGTLAGPATWSQINALSYRLCGTKGGKPNFRFAKQIQGVLYNHAKNGSFSFKQANVMFKNKKLPAKYRNAITAYTKDQK